MSNKPLESGPTDGAGASQAPVSPSQGDQPTSSGAPSYAELLESVRALDAQVRSMQSGKDRGISSLKKQQENFQKQLAEFRALTGEGGVSEQVAMRILYPNLPEEPQATPEPATPQGRYGSQPPRSTVDTDALFKAFGIDPQTDPEVTNLYRQGKTSLDDAAALIKQRTTRPAPQPNPGQVLPTGGGQSVPVDDLQAQYSKELSNIRRGDIAAISRLQAKYQKLGLPV